MLLVGCCPKPEPDLARLRPAGSPCHVIIIPKKDSGGHHVYYVALVKSPSGARVHPPKHYETRAAMNMRDAPATTQGGGGGLPEVEITDGWVYVVGKCPSVGTDTVAAGSDGTRIIVDARDRSTPRLIAIDSASTISAWAHHGSAPTKPLPAGTYTDGDYQNGRVDSWKASGPNSSNTNVMTLINEVQAEAKAIGITGPLD
jgi:hypothetical protein